MQELGADLRKIAVMPRSAEDVLRLLSVTRQAAAKPGEAAAPETTVPVPTYTVKEGDDLVSIAIAYGISPSALMDINDLKATDVISPGQVLKLPANARR